MTSLLHDLADPATPKEIAERLRVDQSIVTRAIQSGALPAVQISTRGDKRVFREHLRAWLEGQMVAAAR